MKCNFLHRNVSLFLLMKRIYLGFSFVSAPVIASILGSPAIWICPGMPCQSETDLRSFARLDALLPSASSVSSSRRPPFSSSVISFGSRLPVVHHRNQNRNVPGTLPVFQRRPQTGRTRICGTAHTVGKNVGACSSLPQPTRWTLHAGGPNIRAATLAATETSFLRVPQSELISNSQLFCQFFIF